MTTITNRTASKALTAFHLQLTGLLADLARLLPDNNDVARAEVAVADVGALMGPTHIIDVWASTVVPLCGKQLVDRDLGYFLALDVAATVYRLQTEGVVPADIDVAEIERLVETSIREPVRAIPDADKMRCMSVLATLTMLATTYRNALLA